MRARLAGALAFALAVTGCESEPACDDVPTVFAGDARIEQGATALPDSLLCAEVVTGDLEIRRSALRTLSGLGRLRHVQGDLEITSNEQLESLAGLDRLQRVDGNVQISSNERLRDLDGLGSLDHVGKSLRISNLERLESLAPLELSLGADLILTSLDALQTLEGLAIASMRGSIEIGYCPELREVGSLLGGLSLDGSLVIRGNDRLVEVDKLPMMRSFGAAPEQPPGADRADVGETCGDGKPAIEIAYNERLERIAVGPDLLDFAGCITVSDNVALREVTLEHTSYELQSLVLDELPALETLEIGTSPLIFIHDRLWIRRLGIAQLEALRSLVEVGCDVSVSDNAELEELLPALRFANRISVSGNERLDTCELEAWAAGIEATLPPGTCENPSYPEVHVGLFDNGGAACE